MSKITGTVKWFSNKKGFGFIAPTSDNSPTTEEIFVHQTSIFSDGDYRTLVEGSEVEFEVEKEDSGKLKAINVTSPGGGPIKPPSRERKARIRKERPGKNDDNADSAGEGKDAAVSDDGGEDGNTGGKGRAPGRRRNPRPPRKNGDSADGPKKEREAPFHDVINEETKNKITEKGVALGQKMTVDVALGDARVKLGQGGYAGLAHASGMVGEGTYKCDENGAITFDWERCLIFADGNWAKADTSELMPSMSLADDGVGPVKPEETAESLWGEDKTDPKDAFAENGFKMKRVVLTRPPGGTRGRRRVRPGKNGKNDNE
jgi:cold shock CspA family protein